MRISREVAERQACDLGRLGQGVHRIQPRHTLHQRHQGASRACGLRHARHALGRFGLGQHRPGHALLHQCLQGLHILPMPGRAFGVGAHQQAGALGAVQGGTGRLQGGTGTGLVRRGYGIFPIGDDDVRPTGQRLGQPLRACGGNKKKRAGLRYEEGHGSGRATTGPQCSDISMEGTA